MLKYDLEDAIVMLHNVARTIEREYGFTSTLSNDIRKCADRVHDLLHTEVPTGESHEVL